MTNRYFSGLLDVRLLSGRWWAISILFPRQTKCSSFCSEERTTQTADSSPLLDPQNDVGLLPVVELAQGFRVTLFALALRIDLIIHIGREFREAIAAVIAGNNGFHRQRLHVLQIDHGVAHGSVALAQHHAGKSARGDASLLTRSEERRVGKE